MLTPEGFDKVVLHRREQPDTSQECGISVTGCRDVHAVVPVELAVSTAAPLTAGGHRHIVPHSRLPCTGWPMPTTGTLKRRNAASPWALAAESALPAAPGHPPHPLEVLETDTLLGLLALDLLPLAAKELASPAVAARSSSAVLVAAVAASGPQEAAAVLHCTPLRCEMRTALMLGVRPAAEVSVRWLPAPLCCLGRCCLYWCVCLEQTKLNVPTCALEDLDVPTHARHQPPQIPGMCAGISLQVSMCPCSSPVLALDVTPFMCAPQATCTCTQV